MNKTTTLVSSLLILLLVLVAGIVRVASQPVAPTPLEHQQQMKARELQQRFQQAVVMLHAREYEHAVAALHRVLELAPKLPEAHVNMGYALLGAEQPDAARGFFEAAIELNARQANAYYGLALADEARGDYERALGGMRTFLHLSREDDPFRPRARSALWEWEQKLGRIPASPGAAASAPVRP